MFSAIRSLRCKHCIFVMCSVVFVLYLCNGLVNRMHVFEKERKVVMPAVRVIPPGQPPHIFNTEGETLGTSTKIPKIIHQTWKTTKMAQMFEKWVRSWIRLNPEWEYWFWTDVDIRKLVEKRFPEHLEMFDSYPTGGYRADAFRYFVLYEYGGFYADLDAECLQPLDGVTAQYECILGQEPEEHAHFLSSYGIPLVSNAIMACRPGHPFFQYVIDNLYSYTGYYNWNDILHATGPYMLTQLYKSYNTSGYSTRSQQSHIDLAKPELFEPTVDYSMLDHMKEKCLHTNDYRYSSSQYMDSQQKLCTRILAMKFNDKIGPGSYTDHHWTHLWAGVQYDPWGVTNWRTFFNVTTLVN